MQLGLARPPPFPQISPPSLAALDLSEPPLPFAISLKSTPLCTDPNIVKTHRILSCAPGIKEAAGPDDIEAIVKIR